MRARKLISLLMLIGFLVPFSSMRGADSTVTALLSDDDWQLERDGYNEGSILSSPLDAEEKWESYNQWMCFPQNAVELFCPELDYNGWHSVPGLIVDYYAHRFEFQLFPDTQHECDATLNEWRNLIDGRGEVCVFAAYLQSIEDGASLWYLDQFKTNRGYWVSAESVEADDSAGNELSF